MTAKIIDGKARASAIRNELKVQVLDAQKKGIRPKLCVVLVGDDPASHIYVANKEKDCAEVGIISETHRLPTSVNETDLIALVDKLNKDRTVHGMIVQLPLPDHISEENVLSKILPSKDVDGLGVYNLGLLFKGEGDPLVSCTPQGCLDLIKTTGIEIKGKNAVVVGRSNIVGKPMAMLLLHNHATVTICHSRTIDLPGITSKADILVAAIGKAKMITTNMVKKGAVVIDVGMNRSEKGLVGDVDFENVKEVAGYITPVPGGVGPMTIAMLLWNTVRLTEK